MSIVLRMWIAGKDKLSSFRVCLEECDEVIDVSSSSIPAKKKREGGKGRVSVREEGEKAQAACRGNFHQRTLQAFPSDSLGRI